ncbi:hypothetical protein BTHE68_40560 [Burkholderia sp. THE68]|uniref:hypothetical protein n=1 Tax=Burkholderia sp. THE68 TaxID=758782 RepID=UPI0013187560|nr:hypothetical protein [Burkholderia sp. THE68]BBU30322.1 hypothetical protein BTHE68_40560 [Burkholderia sp. THE68]
MRNSFIQASSRASGKGQTKSKLLLLPVASSRFLDFSLRGHLAIEAFRCGEANESLLRHFIHLACFAFFLQGYGYGTASIDLFLRVARVLGATDSVGRSTDVWRMSDSDIQPIVDLLALNDAQMAIAPRIVVHQTKERLVKFLDTNKKWPWTVKRSTSVA